MTTSTAAHTFLRPGTTTTTTPKPSSIPPTSTVSKLGDCYSPKAISTHPYGLRVPSYDFTTTAFPAVVDLPVDDAQRHLHHLHVVEDPADDDDLTTYVNKWCDRTDEDFDCSSELEALAEACERMQQRWPTATPTEPPTILPLATILPQQSPTPMTQRSNCDDEAFDLSLEIDELVEACERMQQRWPTATPTEQPTIPPLATILPQQSPTPMTQRSSCDDEAFDLSSAIDELVEACDRMQQRWPTVTTTATTHQIVTATTPERQPNDSDLPAILASLAEFIRSDTDERLDDPPPTPALLRPMSYNETHVLQTQVMAKLIVMIDDLHGKLDLLTAATICPPKRTLDSPTTPPRPVPWRLLTCSLPPQQHTVLGFFKPKGPLESQRDLILRTQLAIASQIGTYTNVIPAKPPFPNGCHPLLMLRLKDGMRPP